MTNINLVVLLVALATTAAAASECSWTVNYTYAGCVVTGTTFGCGQNGWGGPSDVLVNAVVQTPLEPLVKTGNGVMHLDTRIVTASSDSPQPTSVQASSFAGSDARSGGDTIETQFDVYFVSAAADGFFTALTFASPTNPNGTFLALENSPTQSYARLYTTDSAAGSNLRQFPLGRRQWYTIRYRCTFSGGSEPCYTYVNGTLVITSQTWTPGQTYNHVRFGVSRAPSFYGLPDSGSQGVQIDNFKLKIYNISDPTRLASNYSTGFEVCPANVDGCQQAATLMQNNGTCVLPGGTSIGSNGRFNTICPGQRFVGTYCQYANQCLATQCLRNATCTPFWENGNAFCNCPTGWVGSVCQTVDPCNSSPCQHGATCSFQNSGYHCTCPTGRVGTTCQFDDPCLSNPCQHGGACSANPADGTSQCACLSPFGGSDCAEVSAASSLSSPVVSAILIAAMLALFFL
jgi:Notch-like protein